jgi:hypothetical protein
MTWRRPQNPLYAQRNIVLTKNLMPKESYLSNSTWKYRAAYFALIIENIKNRVELR